MSKIVGSIMAKKKQNNEISSKTAKVKKNPNFARVEAWKAADKSNTTKRLDALEAYLGLQ
jgi:hypothetical protein